MFEWSWVRLSVGALKSTHSSVVERSIAAFFFPFQLNFFCLVILQNNAEISYAQNPNSQKALSQFWHE
jgi:hypothetical protein